MRYAIHYDSIVESTASTRASLGNPMVPTTREPTPSPRPLIEPSRCTSGVTTQPRPEISKHQPFRRVSFRMCCCLDGLMVGRRSRGLVRASTQVMPKVLWEARAFLARPASAQLSPLPPRRPIREPSSCAIGIPSQPRPENFKPSHVGL